MVKNPTKKKARMKMGELWSRTNQEEGKDENGRLVVNSPTNTKSNPNYKKTPLDKKCPLDKK